MLKRILLLSLLAVPAFGATLDGTAALSETETAVGAEVDVAIVDTHLVGPEVSRPGKTGFGGNCGYSAPDCPASTGGCGGRPFYSSCNGGNGVCVEACDSFQTGQTMCDCWSFSLAGSVGDGMQVARMLTADDPPKCQRSSEAVAK
ncbi:MAG: hypothetical protein AAF560_03680 [Acidobacteriota bacterium]